MTELRAQDSGAECMCHTCVMWVYTGCCFLFLLSKDFWGLLQGAYMCDVMFCPCMCYWSSLCKLQLWSHTYHVQTTSLHEDNDNECLGVLWYDLVWFGLEHTCRHCSYILCSDQMTNWHILLRESAETLPDHCGHAWCQGLMEAILSAMLTFLFKHCSTSKIKYGGTWHEKCNVQKNLPVFPPGKTS